jgi:hypothetical protein
MMARSAGLEELVSAQHPGTSMAPTMAASTNPRLRGLDNMNPPTVRSASLRLATRVACGTCRWRIGPD